MKRSFQFQERQRRSNAIQYTTTNKSRSLPAIPFPKLQTHNATPLQKTGELPTTKNVVQLLYYNPTDNLILDRPAETEEIAKSKDEAKKEAILKGSPVTRFTAHHKYPWNKIKDDIVKAFVAPKTKDSENALERLEVFSAHELPTTKPSFLNSVKHRETTYNKKTTALDKWIQEVCWVPGNIFLGPLSDMRIDDPSKRVGASDFDGHFTLKRRMSLRSEGLKKVFDLGGFEKESFAPPVNKVAPFKLTEWTKQEMGPGADLTADQIYSQKHDPYFEENIFPYTITSVDFDQQDYTLDSYDLHVTTPLDTDIKGAKYNIKELGPKGDEAAKATVALASTTVTKNWIITINTPVRNLVKDLQLGLQKDNGKRKIISLPQVKFKRVR